MQEKLFRRDELGRLLKCEPTRHRGALSVKEILRSQEIRSYVEVNLERMFGRFGLPLDDLRLLARLIMQAGRKMPSDAEFLAYSSEMIGPFLDARATMHVERIDARKLLSGPLQNARGPICCFGIGVIPEVAQEIGREVFFVDSASACASTTNFATAEFRQDKVRVPSNFSATTIFFNSLHRLNKPSAALAEAKRISQPGGQILIIEPVVGITRKAAGGFGAEYYSYLSTADQYAAAVFFEKFYAGVFHLPRAFQSGMSEGNGYRFRQLSEHCELLTSHRIAVDSAELIGSAFSSGPLVWGRVYGRTF